MSIATQTLGYPRIGKNREVKKALEVLQFVPYDAARETRLPDALRNVLSFAEQKLREAVFLARTLSGLTSSPL